MPAYGPGNVYVLTNGRLEHPPHPVPNKLLSLAGTTIAVMMNASMESVLMRAFLAAKYYGYTFNMTEIPAGVKVGKDPLAFDPTQMRAGFDAGRALAKQPNPWKQSPPNLGDIPAWMMDVVEVTP